MEELSPTHPSDEEAIEQAIEIQAARRNVRHQLDHAQAHPDPSMSRQVESHAAPGGKRL
jgi:hypothetical protein